jgi:hypothetical protein
MLFGVESDAKGPPVWKVMIVNLKPTRVGRLRGALMSIKGMEPTRRSARLMPVVGPTKNRRSGAASNGVPEIRRVWHKERAVA